MPSYTTHYVEVRVSEGKQGIIKSPGFNDLEDARRDLNEIRKAQKDGEWVELDWLSMAGGKILAASLSQSSFGVF